MSSSDQESLIIIDANKENNALKTAFLIVYTIINMTIVIVMLYAGYNDNTKSVKWVYYGLAIILFMVSCVIIYEGIFGSLSKYKSTQIVIPKYGLV